MYKIVDWAYNEIKSGFKNFEEALDYLYRLVENQLLNDGINLDLEENDKVYSEYLDEYEVIEV